MERVQMLKQNIQQNTSSVDGVVLSNSAEEESYTIHEGFVYEVELQTVTDDSSGIREDTSSHWIENNNAVMVERLQTDKCNQSQSENHTDVNRNQGRLHFVPSRIEIHENDNETGQMIILKTNVDNEQRGVKARGCIQRGFRSRQAAQVQNETLGENFHCNLCDFTAASDDSLAAHRRFHAVSKSHQLQWMRQNKRQNRRNSKFMIDKVKESKMCPDCGVHIDDIDTLLKHIRAHSAPVKLGPYACTHCALRTSDKSVIEKHMELHQLTLPFGCDRCEFRSRSHQHLKQHMDAHMNAELNRCIQNIL